MVKFTVKKASDWEYQETIEINNLEELLLFIKENDSIIVERNDEYEITIYDDYIE